MKAYRFREESVKPLNMSLSLYLHDFEIVTASHSLLFLILKPFLSRQENISGDNTSLH